MKRYQYIILMCFCTLLICGCNRKQSDSKSSGEAADKAESLEVTDKPDAPLYDLPISEEERTRLSDETLAIVNGCKEKVLTGLKLSSSGCLYEKTEEEIADDIGRQGISASLNNNYWNMRNYEQIETFLKNAKQGTADGAADIYFINSDGIFNRYHFENEGDVITLTTVDVTWNDGEPVASYMSKRQLESWEYTKKGWFAFEQFVPETADAMNGNEMIRVRPIDSKLASFCSQYLDPIGYQGNNLFLTDWDSKNYKDLDFNDLYEYLYYLRNGFPVDPGNLEDGVPKDDFEGLVTEYFDISKELLRKLASYKGKTYEWVSLGCGNYAPGMSGFPFPEVTKMEKHKDGTITVTVDAVWDGCGLDQAFTHKVTVKLEKGKIKFLGNHVVQSEDSILPQYRHRTKE